MCWVKVSSCAGQLLFPVHLLPSARHHILLDTPAKELVYIDQAPACTELKRGRLEIRSRLLHGIEAAEDMITKPIVKAALAMNPYRAVGLQADTWRCRRDTGFTRELCIADLFLERSQPKGLLYNAVGRTLLRAPMRLRLQSK